MPMLWRRNSTGSPAGPGTSYVSSGGAGKDGEDGEDGEDGIGMPAGGSTDELVAKASDVDYDFKFVPPTSGGAVDSVNGQTGPVVLDAADVGAEATGVAASLIAALMLGTAAQADASDFDPAGTAATLVAALVDSSPSLLNTLNELAAALGDDPNFATTVTGLIAAKQDSSAQLDAIAAITATAYGRGFLTLVDAAAARLKIGLNNVDNTSDATKAAAERTAVATLTNKTLNAPVISSPTGVVKGDVGLGNVDNTSDATKNAATVTLTNKTLTQPTIGDYTNAQHSHAGATSGGTIAHSALTGLTSGDPHTQYVEGSGARSGNPTVQLSSTTGAKAILRIGPDATGSWAIQNSVWIGALAEALQGIAGDGTAELNLVSTYGTPMLSIAATNVFTHSTDMSPRIQTVQTTNATVTTLDTIATASEHYYVVRVLVSARNNAGDTGAGYQLMGAFRNDSGTLTQIGSTAQTVIGENTGTWDATLDANSTNIRVRVTGAASTTIVWDAYTEVMNNGPV